MFFKIYIICNKQVICWYKLVPIVFEKNIDVIRHTESYLLSNPGLNPE